MDFSKPVQDMLKQDKTIVIDEFQRLPESILEDIAIVHPGGKVIFCGSSNVQVPLSAGHNLLIVVLEQHP